MYTWKNKKTGLVMEVERSMADSDVPPDNKAKYNSEWERVILSAPAVDFITMKNKGILSGGLNK
jgi:hypothetical protein